MRKDMAQLLVEHPRRHAGEHYRVHRRRDNRDPNAPLKQGMRRPYIERKEFGEYFAPLLGYLRKNIGRPWDKVFSELNESLTGGGTVVDHVRVHLLRDFVILQPLWHNGVACYPFHSFRGSRNEEPLPIKRNRNGGFYVDQHGLLRQAPPKARWRYSLSQAVPRVPIDCDSAYYKIDGLWYRVWTKELGEPGPDSGTHYDALLKASVRPLDVSTRFSPGVWGWSVDGHSRTDLIALHGSTRVAYRKEQVSTRTIRREKLNER